MSESIKPTYLRFSAYINEDSVKALMNEIQKELDQGVSHFVILISSTGGFVNWGITAYNFLKGIPAEVETHNIGIADSMAVVLHCAGKKRYSAPHARFLIHGVGFTVREKTRLQEKELDEKIKNLKIDTENIAGVIAETTSKSEEEIMTAMYEGTVLNPEQAVEFGLVHEIRAELFEKGAKVITIS